MQRIASMLTLMVSALCIFYGLQPAQQNTCSSHEPVPVVRAFPTKCRVLILRHTHDPMATADGKLAEDSVEYASKKGMDVSVVENCYVADISECDSKIEKYADENSVLCVHSIGHGEEDGTLIGLGKREKVMKAFASHATNGRHILWWDLSCYSCAEMPYIETLPEEERENFAIICSSDSKTPSGYASQAPIMKHLFTDLIDGSGLELDHDNLTADGLMHFLDKERNTSGRMVFANRHGTVIFHIARKH